MTTPPPRKKIPPVREWRLDEWLIAVFGGLFGAELALLTIADPPGWAVRFGALPVVAVGLAILIRAELARRRNDGGRDE